MKTKLLIIGSGPSGLTAAIYAARAQLDPIVITGSQPGGQLTTTTVIDNFPGFNEGIAGPELMANMIKQAERFGATMLRDDCATLDLTKPPFTAKTKTGQTVEADAVILATGSSPRYLNVPGEKELIAHGVHTCATCDGFFYRGKKVGVIGGGDSAMEEALFLTRFADKVTVIHRRDSLRASPIMQERAKTNPKIEWKWNSEIKELKGKEKLESVVLFNNQENKEEEIELDGLFLAIGHVPNSDFFKDTVDVNEEGYVAATNPPFTNLPGVFVAGDVNDYRYRQAITAAGSGCKAALEAQWWLQHGQMVQ